MFEITTKDLVLGIAGRTKDIPTAIRVIQKNALNFNNLVHNTGLAIIVSSMPHDQGGHLDAGRALDFVKAVPGAIHFTTTSLHKGLAALLNRYDAARKEDKVALTPKDIELIETLRRMDAEVVVRAQQVKTAGLLAAA